MELELWGEILLAVLCAAGLAFLSWWLFGRLLRPIPGTVIYAVIPGCGAGNELEQSVRSLVWLRSLGLLRCPVLIADVGLTPAGRELALHLARRWPDVVLWPVQDLGNYIENE